MSNDTASTVKTDNDNSASNRTNNNSNGEMNDEKASGRIGRLWPWGVRKSTTSTPPDNDTEDDIEGGRGRPTKWSMGVLNDPRTHEVPGSVLLLTGYRNEPLGLHNAPARTSHSSLPAQSPIRSRPNSRSSSRARTRPSLGSRRSSRQSARVIAPAKKTKETKNGAIILDPQPEESQNDPLNWPTWRRDAALLSLGFYCMLGGGMTPILAAGFNDISATFHVSTEQVALTTGLYMMGLGVGSVFFSPTAILWGKRPVYLLASIMFSASAIWCASATNFTSLLLGRIFQGIAVSPVECLPSATIAEIFFLHERAYRLGIYTLLLLGGKNLSPLASAAVIQSKGWRWVFWVLAIIVGACFFLLFFFVPETFWDRTPRPKDRSRSRKSSKRNLFDHHHDAHHPEPLTPAQDAVTPTPQRPQLTHRNTQNLHVGFSVPDADAPREPDTVTEAAPVTHLQVPAEALSPQTPVDVRSPAYSDADSGYFPSPSHQQGADVIPAGLGQYTHDLRGKPAQTFVQQLRPWNGRLHYDNWFRVSLRPFVLFAYPAVLWSAVVYACSIGWLIVLSESVSVIYRSPDTYNFSALAAGLVYISPFVGGVLGTAVAGKVSDVIVRIMARRNGGLYEPEFRLVMAAPVAVTTVIGLMGYGWSVEVRDQWIVPTIFFGVISFGCSLGSTTSITFCVDSYRQYAGEALVTLNFSKNVLHGLVFSLFFNSWLHAKGSKSVFIWLGVIQLVLLMGTVPMYIYGKRARMWTARRNLMEKL